MTKKGRKEKEEKKYRKSNAIDRGSERGRTIERMCVDERTREKIKGVIDHVCVWRSSENATE